MMDPAEQAARAFYNAAGGSYAMPEAASAVPVPEPVQGTPEAAPAVPSATPPPTVIEDTGPSFYAPVPTRGMVDWNEPPAQATEYDLQAPNGMLDRSEEGRASLARLRDGLAAAGAGQTVARELFSDAVRAAQERRAIVSRATAETELRQHFGARYDAQVAAARGLVQRAAQRCPEIVPFLDRTGLGNSPEFIRKLAAAAGRPRR